MQNIIWSYCQNRISDIWISIWLLQGNIWYHYRGRWISDIIIYEGEYQISEKCAGFRVVISLALPPYHRLCSNKIRYLTDLLTDSQRCRRIKWSQQKSHSHVYTCLTLGGNWIINRVYLERFLRGGEILNIPRFKNWSSLIKSREMKRCHVF